MTEKTLPLEVLAACEWLVISPAEVLEYKVYGMGVVIITVDYAKITVKLGDLDLKLPIPTTLENQPAPGLTQTITTPPELEPQTKRKRKINWKRT